MRVAFFDTHLFEKEFFVESNRHRGHEIKFFEPRLNEQTAQLAGGFECVCSFVNDRLDAPTLKALSENGTRLIALRSAGFNHVDLKTAHQLGLRVVRVPEYSPYAVAEHTVALALTLNRKIPRAYNRVRDGNFSLNGLMGFDLHGKTVGVIGLGKIGLVFAKIMRGFGCRVLAYDIGPMDVAAVEAGIQRVSLPELFSESDVISLHVPLNSQTRHMINEHTLREMKPGVMLLNTGRGALIDTAALIDALKRGHVGAAGLDVYEEEESVFFEDHSGEVIQDDQLARLLSFPHVVMTSHQAFLTREAIHAIAETTLKNISDFEEGKTLVNLVSAVD